jgi:hypothetical protein
MLAQGQSAVLSFTVDVKIRFFLEITKVNDVFLKKVLGDRTLFLCVPYHKART